MTGSAHPAEHAARAYEQALAGDEDRRRRGAFYTPDHLISWILDRAVGPTCARVLDPSCGTGHFLVQAARRVGARSVWGSDVDADAVAHARARLAALDPTLTGRELAERVRVGDGLTLWEGTRFDAVVGNPPFLGQLRRRSAGATGGLGAYTDTSAAFLHAALDLVSPGGVVGMVQPLSVLAARDAGPVRAAVVARGSIEDFWCSPHPVFADTSVLTCVPIVRVGAGERTDPDRWGSLAAGTFGIPAVAAPRSSGTVADLAVCTADFRDQYYGLRPYVCEDGGGSRRGKHLTAPLITSGLIDPAECRWGRVGTRFARAGYDAPVVDLAALAAGSDAALARWAAQRRVPKLLVAGQGRVIEAVVDADGGWLPSVPVLTVAPHGDHAGEDTLWRLLAVTLAPPVVADAATRYLGTGLSPGSVKVSARQFGALALPPTEGASDWARAADLARAAQRSRAAGGSPAAHVAALADVAATMCHAYGLDPDGDGREVLDWWRSRLGTPRVEAP